MKLSGTLLSRYIFRQTAGAVLLILLSLTGVVWIALALRQLNLVTSQGQDVVVFLKMTLLALPNLMALIAPVALLVASIHVLNRLSGDSELIVMTAGGATIWNIARPLLLVATLVSIAVMISNHFVLPWSLRSLRDHVIQMRTDLISQVIQPGRFSSPEANLTFHIRDRLMDGELKGLVMHDARDQKQVSTYLSERGWIIKQDGDAYLVMETGHILRRTQVGEPIRIVEFQRYAVDLARFEPKEQGNELKPRERYYHELVRPAPNDELAKLQPGLLRAELHERFSSPLYPFAFVMVAVAFVGQSQTTRQNRMQAIVTAFLLSAGCRLGGLAGTNVVALRPSAIWMVYAIPVGVLFAGVILAQNGMRPRRQTRIGALLSGLADGMIEWLKNLKRLRPGQRRAPAGAARGAS